MVLKQQICNFRAQTDADWRDWKWFIHYCKRQGLTTCRPLIAFIRAFRRGMEGLTEAKPEVFNGFPVIVQLEQQNTFVYSVQKPRRTPDLTRYLRNTFSTATTGRRMAEAYILEKAQWLFKRGQRTFCFRDFIKIKHGYFWKLILTLKQRGEIIPWNLGRALASTYWLVLLEQQSKTIVFGREIARAEMEIVIKAMQNGERDKIETNSSLVTSMC